jgi:hypothetical protein
MRATRRALTFIIALLALAATEARGQQLSDAASVGIVTAYPGDAVYNRWGHTAVRVRDPAQRLDVLFNYGTFDFADPLFVPKFAYGQLDYLLSVSRTRDALRGYRAEERTVVEQTLDLDAQQRQRVFDFLRENARPENRVYRYDFLFDNCSTRPRDVLVETLGDALVLPSEPDPDATFRELVGQPVRDDALLTLAFDLALGQTVDRDVSAYEAHFLPLLLMEALDGAALADSAGARPLVARTDTLLSLDVQAAPRAFPWPSLFAWAWLLAGLLVTVKGSARVRRWFDRALYAGVGVAGLILALMGFASLHHVTQSNLNLLWAWPTHLVVAARLRWLVSPMGRIYAWAAALGGFGAVAVWALGVQPLPPAAVPVSLLLAIRLVAPTLPSSVRFGRGDETV